MSELNQRLLSYQDVERLTSVKAATLATLVHRRQIPHIRIAARTVRFDPEDITAWIDARRVRPVGRGSGS